MYKYDEEEQRVVWNAFKQECKEVDSPFNTQVGGDHYKNLPIQPLEYSYKNNLNVFQSNVVKYTTRAPLKGDTVKDIDKAIHYLQMWKETLTND